MEIHIYSSLNLIGYLYVFHNIEIPGHISSFAAPLYALKNHFLFSHRPDSGRTLVTVHFLQSS